MKQNKEKKMRTDQRRRGVGVSGIKRKKNEWSPWKCSIDTAAIRTEGREYVRIATPNLKTVKGITRNADEINPYQNSIRRPTNGVIVVRV
jgi:hypothetical protein